jgi:hypothetical protein
MLPVLSNNVDAPIGAAADVPNTEVTSSDEPDPVAGPNFTRSRRSGHAGGLVLQAEIRPSFRQSPTWSRIGTKKYHQNALIGDPHRPELLTREALHEYSQSPSSTRVN